MSLFVEHHATPSAFTSAPWVILTPIEQRIKEKIEAVGTPLKDWDIQIYRGVLTGCNEAFIIDTAKRDEILSNCQTEEERQRTADLIRPILRGRDIRRYGYDWAGLWLIATFPSRQYDINLYPSLKSYLLSYGMERLEQTGKTHIVNGERIKARKKTNNKWFETQDSISYWEDFSKPKLFYADIVQELNFVMSDELMFGNNSVYFISSEDRDKLLVIQRFLNSKLINWFYRTLSVQLGEHVVRMFSIYVLQIPIPTQSNNNVYESYGLSSDEIDFIEQKMI